MNLSKLVILLIFALFSFLSLTSHRSTGSSSFITLNRPSVTFGLKMSNIPFVHSGPVLWNSLPSHLRHSGHHSTSLPISLTLVSLSSSSNWNLTSFACPFHHNLYSPELLSIGYLWYWPCFVFSSYLHFVSGHLHVIHLCNLLFDLATQMFENKLSLSCWTFISTINQRHSILLFIITSPHLISFRYFSSFILFAFIWSKKLKLYRSCVTRLVDSRSYDVKNLSKQEWSI